MTTHPYAAYIESKAVEYYERQAHEPPCKTLQPYRPPTGTNGETYDVYMPQHCDCWLSDTFKEMTLARKFFALRNLAHSFGLHSADCNRYKRTSITYRNRPEVMTGWCNCWLGVDMRPEHACPACAKPLFYAPYAPEDTAKMACSDPNCVNAHGIVELIPVDNRPNILVDYSKAQEQRKDHTMGDLHIAKHRAEVLEQAQRDIDNFLAPFVKQFVEFQSEFNARAWDQRDSKADTFVEVERESFYLRGEEVYEYGETYTPTLNLPFAFVEDPATYMETVRAKLAEAQEKAAAKKKKDAEELVERLKAHLAKAEADVKAADAQKDAIKSVANSNAAKDFRAKLAIRTDKG